MFLSMCNKRTWVLWSLYRDDKNGFCRQCLGIPFLALLIVSGILGFIFLPFYIGQILSLNGLNIGITSRRCISTIPDASFYCWIVGILCSVIVPFLLFGLFYLSKRIYHEFKEKSAKAEMFEVKIQD